MKYPGTIHCRRCDSIYKPGPNWRLVQHHAGTTGGYDVVGRIPVDQCPMCRQAPQLTAPLEARSM